ncbi:hypothetical protein SAMN05216320_1011167 [Duganella sp. OV458]|nr:hypothetical protein SAMN05216320_1011167 [Duganella sp. OV458]SDI55190.1 hypothetical protein SAMN05428973_101248 [Duganella sp. OV510]
MSEGNQGERIVRDHQLVSPVGVIQQLCGGEVEHRHRSLYFAMIGGRAPSWIVIRQHDQTGDRSCVLPVYPVVVVENAPCEGGVASGLDFYVNEHPRVVAEHADLGQEVSNQPVGWAADIEACQFLVAEEWAVRPVDPCAEFGKEEGHEFPEGICERCFPRGVITGRRGGISHPPSLGSRLPVCVDLVQITSRAVVAAWRTAGYG